MEHLQKLSFSDFIADALSWNKEKDFDLLYVEIIKNKQDGQILFLL